MMHKILDFLRSERATLSVLVLALLAQTPHAARLFHVLEPATSNKFVWGAVWLEAWTYALALEAAVLLFVMRGRIQPAWLFAAASIATNALYYATHGATRADVLPAGLISLMLPVAIALYSHDIAHTTPTGEINTEATDSIATEEPDVVRVNDTFSIATSDLETNEDTIEVVTGASHVPDAPQTTRHDKLDETQAEILAAIEQHGPFDTYTEVGEHAGFSRTTASRHVKTLAERGYVSDNGTIAVIRER